MLIPNQANVTLQSRELTPASAQILYMLGGGHPGKIVKLACECEPIQVSSLKEKGESIVASIIRPVQSHVVIGNNHTTTVVATEPQEKETK